MAVGLMLAACGSGTRTVTVTQPTTTSRSGSLSAGLPRVYVASACSGHAYRPPTVVGCGTGQLYADELRYASYGGSVAQAHGEVRRDDCQPDCASGQFVGYPGEITLSRVVRCDDVRPYYGLITFRIDTPNPSSIGPYPIVPNLRCSPTKP